ncbi:MAG: hypothetical protein LH481_13300, partial [Burkholderiales bacterium]|nr:hypothetical protein [Burkholderiales bacterium]
MNLSIRSLLVMLIIATFAACAAKRPAPVSDARPPADVPSMPSDARLATKPAAVVPAVDASKLHTIQKGDTLISVALA